jgi:cytochrome P450
MLGWYDAMVASVNAITAGEPPTEAGRAAFAALHERVAPNLHLPGLDTDEAVSNAAVLLFGGIETTEGMIANALYHLLSNPRQLALVRADPTLVPNAIEESLRLEPAAAVIDRYSTRPVDFGGAHIADRDQVTLSLAAANRDPAFFERPDEYDVTRESARHHVAFAHGPHVCIGMHLARLEARTAVTHVLERLPKLRLAEDHPPTGLVFRKPQRVDAAW